MQEVDHHRIMPGGIDHDFTLQGDRIDMDNIVACHFGCGAVDDDAFEHAFAAQDQIDDPRQVHDLRAGVVGGGNQRSGGMRRIDHVHAGAFLDLLARHAHFFENLMRGGADGGFVHQIPAGPEAAAEGQTLLYDEGLDAHPAEIVGANEAGWPGADDDDVTLDQLIELFIVLPRNLAGDVALA